MFFETFPTYFEFEIFYFELNNTSSYIDIKIQLFKISLQPSYECGHTISVVDYYFSADQYYVSKK